MAKRGNKSKGRARVRRVFGRASGGFRRFTSARGKFGGFFKSGLMGDTVSALGASTVTSAVASRVAPQFADIAGAVAGYATGGIGGMALAEFVKNTIGLPSIFQRLGGLGILGGGSQQVEQI
jgi:hypothetical protein